MLAASDLFYPINEHIHALAPVVFLEDGVYIKASTGEAEGVSFVPRSGGVAHLRRLMTRNGLREFVADRNMRTLLTWLQGEIDGDWTNSGLDDLQYLVETLLPLFDERDWSRGLPRVDGTSLKNPRYADDRAVVQKILDDAAPAAWPIPSVLMEGSFWPLRAVNVPGRGCYVRQGQAVLARTTSQIPVKALETTWREAVIAGLPKALAALKAKPASASSAEFARARAELERNGYFQSGDVIFLREFAPLVGHLVPAHYNLALRRRCDRDLAVVVPMTGFPRLLMPRVYVKNGQGRWSNLTLLHGLCLGASPHNASWLADLNRIAPLAYLRWAAVRIAVSGAFHERDLHREAGNNYE